MRKVGDKIGGVYEVKEILGGPGTCGMGEVYLCFYRWHQKFYVLKTYQEHLAASERFTKAFHHEANLWMMLGSHPNVVRALWVHRLDGRIYVVMERVLRDQFGRLTLSDHLKNGSGLPLLRCLIWAIQFCRGMEYANSLGVVLHRDIKPDNLLITPDKTLKIADFGLSKAAGAEFRSEGVRGTLPWMAPEQFERGAELTTSTDMYSFGIVLYQMATGTYPFTVAPCSPDEALSEFGKMHREDVVPTIDSPLYPMICKCMAKKQEERYQDFGELRRDLEGLWGRVADLPLPCPQRRQDVSVQEINQQGVAMKHLGRPADALKYHDEAILIDPTFPNAWNDKGVALWDLDRLNEALDHFERAIRLDHEFIQPRANKAALLMQMGKFEESLSGFDEGISIDPEFINLWRGKGDCLLRLRRWKEAEWSFDRAIDINPYDSWVWYGKATSLIHQAGIPMEPNDPLLAKAEQCAQKALDIDIFFVPAYELLGSIQRLRGDDKKKK